MTVLALDHLQIAMPKGREAEGRAFYGGVLGLTELPKPPELAKRGGCWFACGPLQLHLGVEAEFSPAKKAHPAFLVTDLAAMEAKVRAAGYSITSDAPSEGRERFFTADPFGNRIELIGRRP
jgi:catechol 2,3-dioxygenase-like lactoylglutathione lyase family enzyme